MRSDLDEQDLYPPDAEDADLTPEAKNHRLRAAIGATLLTWGMSLIIELTLGIDFDTFVLGIGIGALAGWSQVRRYNWFAVGSIAAGLGAAEVIGAVLQGAFGAAVGSLAVAAGFAAIYVRYPRRSMWALVPAAIMALIAAGAFGVGMIGLLPAVFGRFLLPLLLVVGGALLLFRHSLPPKTVKVGLAALAVTFVLVGANSVPEIDPARDFEFGPNPPQGFGPGASPLPSLDGRTLVLVGDTGSVTFAVAEDGDDARIVPGDTRRFGHPTAGFVIEEHEDKVVVSTSGEIPRFRGAEETDLTVYLPEGVEVDVERRSGSVGGTLVGARGSITTTSGDVRLTVVEGGAEGFDDDGPFKINSDSGHVRLESPSPLRLEVDSDDGPIWIDGDDGDGGEYDSPDELRGIAVDVETESGPIRVETGSAASPPAAPTAPTAPAAPAAPEPPASGARD